MRAYRRQKIVRVTDVQCVGSYRLRLEFEDGEIGALDFSAEEWSGVFEPLRDPAYFRRVELDDGARDDCPAQRC